jgi:hypothetical protein
MWLLGRLTKDYKSIAEFRRMHREAVSEAGAELVRFAGSVGLVRGGRSMILSSRRSAVKALEQADEHDEVVIDPSAVSAALQKLNSDPEPEAHFMRMANGYAPVCNVQTAVDAEHAIIVARQVTTGGADNRSLLPMAAAAKQTLRGQKR